MSRGAPLAMSRTKAVLALYPALLVVSLHLTGCGMADQLDLTPRLEEWLWLIGIGVLVPAIHLFALRRITRDRAGYRVAALIGVPITFVPFIGWVVGISIYGVLTYLLATRGRSHNASSCANPV